MRCWHCKSVVGKDSHYKGKYFCDMCGFDQERKPDDDKELE